MADYQCNKKFADTNMAGGYKLTLAPSTCCSGFDGERTTQPRKGCTYAAWIVQPLQG